MPPIHDQFRLARKIHAVYQQAASRIVVEQQADWSHLEYRFELARQQRELVQKARLHGWQLAAHQQQDQFCAVLRTLAQSLESMQAKMLLPPQPIPSLKDLLDELQNLDKEFDDVVFDKKPYFDVRTEPIRLEDIELGRFAIRWHWPRMANGVHSDCFDIIALDPKPAKGSSDVTHPHVRSRSLCVGDAALPLKSALAQGRLTDAFQIIHSVLKTYNKDSAYASLDDWDGVSCWNCGCSTGEDDRSCCDSCEQDVCSDCISSCKHCDRYHCDSCQTRCDVCNDSCCSRCLKTSDPSKLSCCKDCLRTCTECEAEVASSEFDNDSELCPTCLENHDSADADTANNDDPLPVTTS